MTEQEKALYELKIIILEDDFPHFEDDRLIFFLEKNGWDVKKTAYQCLIIKAETTGISVSGLQTKDSASYFKMLASKYRPNNSGTLRSSF